MTKEQINEQYTQLCTQLGDVESKISILQDNKEFILKQIKSLNKQITELMLKEAGGNLAADPKPSEE